MEADGVGGPVLPPTPLHPIPVLLDFSLQEPVVSLKSDRADSEPFSEVVKCSGVWKKGRGVCVCVRVCAYACVGASVPLYVGLVGEGEPTYSEQTCLSQL